MKRFIQSIFNKLGYEVIKWIPDRVEREKALNKERAHQAFLHENEWLMAKKMKSIIDIGANEGQFAQKIRVLFPEAAIYSFEPIPQVYEILKENFKDDPAFFAYNLGLGEVESSTKFFLNEYSPSSSLLKMNEIHKDNFPFTKEEYEIEVSIQKLDNVLNIDEIEKPYLVKIDVQGFEEYVIRGGEKVIQNADYIIIETSIVELYEGEPSFDVIYKHKSSV
ncbi:MAG: FkbM family methyltransferase, partial [Dysgonomonas sp.]